MISTVGYETYTKLKKSFFTKHNGHVGCETSPMDSYGVYYKTYTFADGATWYERMSPELIETRGVEVKGYTIPVKVKMFKVEFWNSDEAFSKFYYEVFNHAILNTGVTL